MVMMNVINGDRMVMDGDGQRDLNAAFPNRVSVYRQKQSPIDGARAWTNEGISSLNGLG
jgi:hypothetical protein